MGFTFKNNFKINEINECSINFISSFGLKAGYWINDFSKNNGFGYSFNIDVLNIFYRGINVALTTSYNYIYNNNAVMLGLCFKKFDYNNSIYPYIVKGIRK